MAPLAALPGKVMGGKLAVTPGLLKTSNAAKSLIAENVLLAFPAPNVPCNVHCADVSDSQLGAVIKQDNKAIAFFSRKLSVVQLKHLTVDEEMLCVVEVQEKCQLILWGATPDVCPDCVNPAWNTVTSDHIITW